MWNHNKDTVLAHEIHQQFLLALMDTVDLCTDHFHYSTLGFPVCENAYSVHTHTHTHTHTIYATIWELEHFQFIVTDMAIKKEMLSSLSFSISIPTVQRFRSGLWHSTMCSITLVPQWRLWVLTQLARIPSSPMRARQWHIVIHRGIPGLCPLTIHWCPGKYNVKN